MNAQDTIEKAIIECLGKVSGIGEDKSNAAWTNIIKGLLGELGQKYGYKTFAGGINNKYQNEWLYDIVWYRRDSENYLENVAMVAESEWNMDFESISYDFEKLLVARSGIKLMIFQVKEDDNAKVCVERLCKIVGRFQLLASEESYIFAVFNTTTEDMFAYIYNRENGLEKIAIEPNV